MTPPNTMLPNAMPFVVLLTMSIPSGNPGFEQTIVSGPYARFTTTDPGVVTAQLPLSFVSLHEAEAHPGVSTVMD